MAVEVEVLEVDELATAIGGLEVDYVRTDRGVGPIRLMLAETNDLVLSVGRMGFSATASMQVSDGVVVFGLITQAPQGGVWCGTELAAGQLFAFAPGTTFVGWEPTGLAATVLVASVDSLATAGVQLGLGEPVLRRVVKPVPHRPQTARLIADLWAATAQPDLVERPLGSMELLESAARALVDVDTQPAAAVRRLDRRRIVSDCLESVEASGSFQPSMSELCRATNTSASCVRGAFVEVFDMPPTQYFQHRLLSRLRVELLRADPANTTVTGIAGLLGVTHLGRTSGRYRAVFGEVPSQTLLSTA
jgi:AraC-like DNA-binding protein